MESVEISMAELKQLRKENRILQKKLSRAHSDLESLERIKRSKEALHTQVIVELQQSQDVLEAQTAELQRLLDDLKNTQDKLVEAEKHSALGRLVAGVAHEISTPVGTSITLASTLADETQQFHAATQQGQLKRSQLNHYLEVSQETTALILHNLNRAGELVKTFKQVSVDQSHHDLRTFAVKAYLSDVCKSLTPLIHKAGHNYSISGEEIEMEGYPGLLAQVVTNFITNSLQHAYPTGKTGHLSLTIHHQPGQLILRYQDDGCGIAAELLPRVYDPFFTTGKETGGTGLGLHIVYNIVRQKLKGDIQITSQVDHGTQIHVAIPISSGSS